MARATIGKQQMCGMCKDHADLQSLAMQVACLSRVEAVIAFQVNTLGPGRIYTVYICIIYRKATLTLIMLVGTSFLKRVDCGVWRLCCPFKIRRIRYY